MSNPCELHKNVSASDGYCPICLLDEVDAIRAENQRLRSLIKTMWPMLVASIDFTEHGTHKSLEAMRNYYQHNPLTPEQIDLMMEIIK